MQKVGCITSFLYSINATRKSNENGRFSAQLGLRNVDWSTGTISSILLALIGLYLFFLLFVLSKVPELC